MAKNKKIPEINASSQADIAFTVLIFFLVVSTMDVDTGIVRVLPPWVDPNVKQEDIKVKERNLLLVFVSGSGNIMAGGKVIALNALKDKAKEFIVNSTSDEKETRWPEVKVTEIEMPDGSKWEYPVSEGVISLQNTRDTSYEVYIQVQNELTRAFNEVRDELSMAKFGREFAKLEDAERKVITKAVPMKISEAEPRKMMK
ncbi:MAG: biopolymer transporter ExbD [Alistipes sp.]|nr:biopolymer transporter ExbD [Alistipes sp.]